MTDILYHIPGLNPGIVTRIGAENAEQKEAFAQSMCQEVAGKYCTKIAYFCGTGKAEALRERFGIEYMPFLDFSKHDFRWVCGQADSLVEKSFARLVVIDSLEALLEKVPEEKRADEKKMILDELWYLARYRKVPVVLLSDHPTEWPCLGGFDLFKDAIILSDAA